MGHLVSVVELGKLVLHRYGPQNVSRPLIQNTQNEPHIRCALQEISKSSTAIRALIIDFFCTSALPIAKELHFPTHFFYTSGAAALAAFLYFPKLHEQTTKSFQDLTNTVFEIPGLKSPLTAIHMVQPMLDRDRPAYWDMLYLCSHLPKSNGIIVKTVEELEPASTLKAIVQGLCVSDGPTPLVYHIGPLIDEDPVMLPRKGRRTACCAVIFLCLRSRGSFSLIQLKEVAKGLERSGKRFLWVVKKPPVDVKTKQVHGVDDNFDLEGLLPEGFLERTNDRGMVVKSWAPQAAVLKKESVGGFVTHCGWISVLEAVVSGVPLIAWPLYAEQHMNRNVLVNDMEIALRVEERERGRWVRERGRIGEESEGVDGVGKRKALRERSKKTGEMALDKQF